MSVCKSIGGERDGEREDNALQGHRLCQPNHRSFAADALKHCDQPRLSLQGALNADLSVLAACHFRLEHKQSGDRHDACVCHPWQAESFSILNVKLAPRTQHQPQERNTKHDCNLTVHLLDMQTVSSCHLQDLTMLRRIPC